MLNVIPRFISNTLSNHPDLTEGEFNGTVMFADIVNFTLITEQLMVERKDGAEKLSILINKIYTPLINIIYDNNGFVANFAGDAIIAVFPEDSGPAVLRTAHLIQKNFKNRKKYYQKYCTSQEINVRIGLTKGEIFWSVFGEAEKTYAFYGQAIIKSSEITKGITPGETVISENLPSVFDPLLKKETHKVQQPLSRIKPNIVKQFFKSSVINRSDGGEFRNVVAVFIAFKWLKNKEELQNLINDILVKTANFGGYFNALFNDDKGAHALILFGAPVCYENNTERAVELVAQIIKSYGKQVKISITKGTVYAGFVGSRKRSTYTVLGDTVNQSARIMQSTPWGNVRVNKSIYKDNFLTVKFSFKDLGEQSVKGKTRLIHLYELETRSKLQTKDLVTNHIVGRKKEITKLLTFCQPILKKQFAGVTYIYGDAGIGKSLLVSSFIKTLQSKNSLSISTYTLQSDEILQKSLNPFIYFLKNYFGQMEMESEKKKETRFNKKWIELLEQLDNLPASENVKSITSELKRTKSFIASLLGYTQKNSLHDNADAKGRFRNTLFALKELIKALSLLKPTILILEDTHWLDEDSRNILKALVQNVSGFPFWILVLSRFNDDNSTPKLDLDQEICTDKIFLKPLTGMTCNDMIKQQLGGKTSNQLLKFVSKRTEGNPFYIEQFCCYLQENFLIKKVKGEFQLEETDFDIPSGIQSILVARIDRLSLQLKDLAQRASVLGREFNVLVLSSMLQTKTKKINPLLLEGEKEDVWSVLSEISFIFKHALLRDVVYSMQLGQRLKPLHKLAAKAIENLFKNDKNYLAEIAHHYHQADLLDKAQQFYLEAADFARDEFRNQEALLLYRKLSSICKKIEDKINAELEIASTLILQGDWEEADNILQLCTEEAIKFGDEKLIAKCYSKSAKLFHRKGLNDKAIYFINKANTIFIKENNYQEIASTRNLLGNINHITGNPDEALANFALSDEAAIIAGDEKFLALNASNIGNVYLYQYDLDKAEKYYKIAVEKAIEINDKITLSNTKANMAIVYYYRLEYEKCQQLFDEFIYLAKKLGNKEKLGYIYGNIGVLHNELGKIDSALEFFNKQLEMGLELADLYNISLAKRMIAQIIGNRGEYKKSLKFLFEALKINKKIEDSRNICITMENIGMMYLATGNYSEAEKFYRDSINIAEKIPEKYVMAGARISMAEISAKKNNFSEAHILINESLDIRREVGDPNELMAALTNATEIYLTLKNRKLAQLMINEAIHISKTEKTTSKKEVVDNLKLLKILAFANKESKDNLLTLKSEITDNKLLARVNFELFLLTNSNEYGNKAKHLYKQLYDQVPKADYKEKLEALGLE